MLAIAPISSPSHHAGLRPASAAAESISKFDVALVVGAVVAIGAVVAPSFMVPAVVIVAVLAIAYNGLRGAVQALEPIAEGRRDANAAAAIVNLNFTR